MKKLIMFVVLIIIIPILIVGLSSSTKIINNIKYGYYANKVVKVKRTETNEILNIPLEEYVIGVVAGEMPVTFNIEALKAQAVASRTYALKKIVENNEYDVTDTTSNQVYIDDSQQKNKWKDNYTVYKKKVTDAVKSTKGEVLLYNNNLIEALFFSTSNGYTENSEDVFSNSKPYLKSVASSWDSTESPVFSTTKEVPRSEFLFNLGLNSSDKVEINNVEKTSTGRVKSLIINNKKFTSSEIRKIFSLKSTSFDIKVEDNLVVFNVNGFGHGVGMSQYGANGMAKEGSDYKKILNHYYQNCEIKKVN